MLRLRPRTTPRCANYSTSARSTSRPVVYQKKPFLRRPSTLLGASLLGYSAYSFHSDAVSVDHANVANSDLYASYFRTWVLSSQSALSILKCIAQAAAWSESTPVGPYVTCASSKLFAFLIAPYVAIESEHTSAADALKSVAHGSPVIISNSLAGTFDDIRRLVDLAADIPGPSCVCVDLTKVVDPSLLKRGTESLIQTSAFNKQETLFPATFVLDDRDIEELDDARVALVRLAQDARRKGVKVIVSAATSFYQPAIDRIVSSVEAEVNRAPSSWTKLWGSPKKPSPDDIVLYRTVQAYLEGARDKVHRILDDAAQGNYGVGVQLVRGEYRGWELRRFFRDASFQPHSALAETCTVCEGKVVTDASYNKCALALLAASTNDKPTVASIFATHNDESIRRVLSESTGSFAFAQDAGIRDDLMHSVQGRTAYKRVPLIPLTRLSEFILELPEPSERFDYERRVYARALYNRW